MEKILIFGRGALAEILVTDLEIDPNSVIGFVESKKSNDTILGGDDSINSSGRKFLTSTR